MNLLDNLTFIFQSQDLVKDFFLCSSLGIASFLISLKLCGQQSKILKIIKYSSALVSVSFISNFFFLLVQPMGFAIYTPSMESLRMTLFCALWWIIVYEAYLLYDQYLSKPISYFQEPRVVVKYAQEKLKENKND